MTRVVENSPGEYFIYVDYGDGMHCAYGEIGKPLVVDGQKVKHLDPIGEPWDMRGFEAGEIESYCADSNRHDGTISSAGWQNYQAVSPFDYVNYTRLKTGASFVLSLGKLSSFCCPSLQAMAS